MFIVAEGKSAMKFDAHSVELDKDLIHGIFSCGSIPLPPPPHPSADIVLFHVVGNFIVPITWQLSIAKIIN